MRFVKRKGTNIAVAERPLRRRLAPLVVATVLSWCAATSLAASGTPSARAADAGIFAAKAAASGVRMTVEVPNAPATDTPVDGGGPTAQAALSSVGESIGFAAFPDPGGLVISAPGLFAGLSGAPVSPPEYPLFVSSDSTTRPQASAGAGPYALHAESDPASSRATATAGLASDSNRSAGEVSSAASVTSTADRVLSLGTTEVAGLVVGPLAIGRIRSSAQLVRNPDGSRTPSSDLELSGVTVADRSVQVRGDDLDLAGAGTIPLPVGAAAGELLKAQGITVEVVGVSATEGTVVSPALRIRFPSSIPDVGTAVVTMVIGNSVASLTSSLTTPDTPAGDAGPGVTAPPGTGLPSTDGAGIDLGPAGIGTDLGGAVGVAPVSADQTQTALRTPAQPSIDISSLYLVCALALAVVFVMSQVIRLGGVRARWKN